MSRLVLVPRAILVIGNAPPMFWCLDTRNRQETIKLALCTSPAVERQTRGTGKKRDGKCAGKEMVEQVPGTCSRARAGVVEKKKKKRSRGLRAPYARRTMTTRRAGSPGSSPLPSRSLALSPLFFLHLYRLVQINRSANEWHGMGSMTREAQYF